MNHPQIIKLLGVYDTTTNIVLILELVPGGELFQRIIAKEFYSERYHN